MRNKNEEMAQVLKRILDGEYSEFVVIASKHGRVESFTQGNPFTLGSMLSNCMKETQERFEYLTPSQRMQLFKIAVDDLKG